MILGEHALSIDDPWADWCLLKTLDALEEAGRMELQEVREAMGDIPLMNELRDKSWSTVHSLPGRFR